MASLIPGTIFFNYFISKYVPETLRAWKISQASLLILLDVPLSILK